MVMLNVCNDNSGIEEAPMSIEVVASERSNDITAVITVSRTGGVQFEDRIGGTVTHVTANSTFFAVHHHLLTNI
jgi:hypothetical protein